VRTNALRFSGERHRDSTRPALTSRESAAREYHQASSPALVRYKR